MGSDPDSGIGCPELSDSGGSGGSQKQQQVGRSGGVISQSFDGASSCNLMGRFSPPPPASFDQPQHTRHHHPPPLRTFSQPEESADNLHHLHHHNHHHHHHHRHVGGVAGGGASRDLWTEDKQGRPQPLKGILKNGQFSTLPAGCSCEMSGLFSRHSQADLLLFGAVEQTPSKAAAPREKLRKDEVLDTVESSV
jgi:hypothetical protein